MYRFIAYFDFLGFKQFILNNDIQYQKDTMLNLFRNIESSISNDKLIKTDKGLICDLSEMKIKCLNFSDTVIFWTIDNSIESFKQLLYSAYKFNYQSIRNYFPVRGAIVYGEIVDFDYSQKNDSGGNYQIKSLIGKGILDAYNKAENQNWAGTVIDDGVIDEIIKAGIKPEIFFSDFALKHKIPYKDGYESSNEEYALCLVKPPVNNIEFNNITKQIINCFSYHNRTQDGHLIKDKIENTLDFLRKQTYLSS